MPKAFQVNGNLPADIAERVAARLSASGYELADWPQSPIGEVAAAPDVAVLIVGDGLDLAGTDARVLQAVQANIRIVIISLDASAAVPSSAESYSSSTVGLDSDSLETALNPDEPEIQENRQGGPAEDKRIKHNKC